MVSLQVCSLACAAFFLVTNSATAETSFEITIIDDKAEGSQIHRKIGQQLSLNCSVMAPYKKPMIIKWSKHGKLLSSSNATDGWSAITISNVSFSDGGFYKCKVMDDREMKTAGKFVNIEGKPVIIRCCDGELYTFKPVFVLPGGTQTMKCFASGWPLPDLKWLYNGIELTQQTGKESGSYILEMAENGLILQLTGMVKNGEGKYTCQASNPHGKDINNYDVTVLGPASDPYVQAERPYLQATTGQSNVTLTCKGKGVREQDADTRWFYNGKRINDTRLAFHTDYYDQKEWGGTRQVKMLLTIFNITMSDHGNYTCKIYVADQIVKATILLDVRSNDSNKPSSHQHNMLSIIVIIPLAIGSVLLLSAIVAMVMIYRRKRNVTLPKIPKGPFKYGAFITYSSQDYVWVKENLLPLLEENGIEHCIHYRNFDVGVLLEENIVNCVYRSRVVIAIMSKSYMKSKYCRSELNYAIHRTVEEPDFNPLITLMIDKTIKYKQLPLAVRRKTFLDVTSEVEKDNWKQRLLMHVKGKDGDHNCNVVTNGNANEDVALLDPNSGNDCYA